MQGLSLRNVAVKLVNAKGKVLFKDFGELLFPEGLCIYNPTGTSELPPPIAALKYIFFFFLILGSATLVVRQEANRESLLNSYL